jgi:hypothetical protein
MLSLVGCSLTRNRTQALTINIQLTCHL